MVKLNLLPTMEEATVFLIRSLFIAALLLRQAAAVTIPAGTDLTIRLSTPVSSSEKKGEAVSAVLVVPVLLNGAPAIDIGTAVNGKVAAASQYKANGTDGSGEQPATLRLQFDRIVCGGKSLPLSSVLTSVDNARETVDTSTGLITGIQKSQTYGAQLDRGVAKLAERYGQFGDILNQVKSSFVKEVDPAIDFKAGVDLTVRTTQAFDWPGQSSKPPVSPIAPADQLATLVNSQPLRTQALKPPAPSDLTNIMFIGTAEQVQGAFQSAGWFPAAALSQASKMETARAIIEDRGYNEAPMSILTLEGRPPDLALQRQNDTFSMRHHIRLWQQGQQFDGKPVWVAAATHDISITFSQESKSFTHGIDPNIDLERAKVVNDMLFTGQVHGVALVDRTNLPPDPSNATGDKLVTDGKMAVVQF